MPTCYRALDMALHNDYINASTSAFLGNWLVSFTRWVERTQGAASLVQLPGCYNPYANNDTVQANLREVVHPRNISGCVPQDKFYPLLNQVSV